MSLNLGKTADASAISVILAFRRLTDGSVINRDMSPAWSAPLKLVREELASKEAVYAISAPRLWSNKGQASGDTVYTNSALK